MEPPPPSYNTIRSTCAQVLACLAFNCLSVNLGFIIGMPVVVIGALQGHDKLLHFTEEQASWFGGLIFITQPLGSLFSGFIQDRVGRKACMMLVNVPQLIAWLMLYKATSVTALFIAEIILGISIGFMEAPVLSYIGEISEPRLRGVLSTFGGIFFNIGVLLQMMIAALVDWRTMALIDAIGPVIAFTALSLTPESPAWLVAQGRIRDAEKVFQWLRGWVSAEQVQYELQTLVKYVQTRTRSSVSQTHYVAVPEFEGELVSATRDSKESQIKIFLQPSIQRPLRLIVIFFVIAISTSLSAMRPFILDFLDKLKLPLESHWILVIINFLTLMGALTSTLVMPFLKKRGLTFISLFLSVCCCFALGIYLMLDIHLPWIPVGIFALSFFSVPLGIICVPWILISELFPLKGRGMASGVAGAIAYVIIFIVVKTYYNIVAFLTVAGACFFYGTIGLLGFVYLYYQLPETEGVPLEEIEKLYGDETHQSRE